MHQRGAAELPPLIASTATSSSSVPHHLYLIHSLTHSHHQTLYISPTQQQLQQGPVTIRHNGESENGAFPCGNDVAHRCMQHSIDQVSGKSYIHQLGWP